MNLRKQKKKQILFMIYWSGYDQHHREETAHLFQERLRDCCYHPCLHHYGHSRNQASIHTGFGQLIRICDCTPIVTNVSEAPTVPRQEHPQIYWQQSGDLDITYRETLQSGSMYGEKILPYYLEKPSPDIDMPSDLQSFQ